MGNAVSLLTRFQKPNIVALLAVGFAENIIAAVTDSVQLKKNDELKKFIKNSNSGAAPGRRPTMAGLAANDTQAIARL